MTKPQLVFSGVAGLNNKTHPARLQRSDGGVVELAEAVNIDISDRYKPRRRMGQLATAITSPAHSFQGFGDFALCVSGSSLLQVSKSFTTTTIRSDLTPGRPMTYAELGGRIFYANGEQNGYVQDGTHHAWVAPGTYWDAVDSSRSFSSPPVGHLVLYAFGRIWIAQESVLWFTESFAPYFVDMARNAIPFARYIQEVVAVQDGLFVSTTGRTVFLRGPRPDQMVQEDVVDYHILPGTVVYTQAEDVAGMGEAGIHGRVALATTTKGICAFGPGGFIQNFTHRKLDLPVASRGSAYIYNGKYVVSLTD